MPNQAALKETDYALEVLEPVSLCWDLLGFPVCSKSWQTCFCSFPLLVLKLFCTFLTGL